MGVLPIEVLRNIGQTEFVVARLAGVWLRKSSVLKWVFNTPPSRDGPVRLTRIWEGSGKARRLMSSIGSQFECAHLDGNDDRRYRVFDSLYCPLHPMTSLLFSC